MSFLSCSTSFKLNDDGTSSFSVTMDEVTTKCMKSFCAEPEEWIKNCIISRSQTEGERIYKSEIERHLENGTMPINATKASLILDAELPDKSFLAN